MLSDVFSACGREAELDERLDPHAEEGVVQLVDLRPVVDRLAVDDLHGAEVVVEDGVEADVTKAELVDRDLELRRLSGRISVPG